MSKDNSEQTKKKTENEVKNKSKINQNNKIIKSLFEYIMENKKWWLIPFFIVLAFFVLFIIFAGNNSVMPTIYALF